MSKRRYKSVEFKKVNWNLLSERIEGERIVFAIDVAHAVTHIFRGRHKSESIAD